MEESTAADGSYVEQWVPLLYQELRRIAHRERWRVSSSDTIGTTALVNEVYLRLGQSQALRDRGHFLGVAAIAMRRILVDRVRAQLAAKRGRGVDPLPLEATDSFIVEDEEAVLAVHDALETLAAMSPRLARIVECRFFAGYNEDETAEALGISVSTVQRDWATARAWLKRELAA